MGTAKVISMTSQPRSVSYLCFEIGGILDTRTAELGELVNDISYEKLCGLLKDSNVSPTDPSRLQGDADGIRSLVDEFSLATLRNEDRKAILNSAVNSRQNVYFSKYANSAFIISTIRAYYSRQSATSKPNRLQTLSDIAQQQAMDLQEAYTEDGVGVVKSTSSFLESSTRSNGSSMRGGSFIQESVGRNVGKGTRLPHILPAPWNDEQNKSYYESSRFKAPETAATALTVGRNYEESRDLGRSSGTQSATHIDYEYRTPNLEARARNNRAQISLMDQQFEAYMFEQNMPHLEKIFENELASVDNDVYQLQIALLRSFLTSPVPGIVTGVFKNPGEAVDAGEPVVRVEDHHHVQLVAEVVHYGPVGIGSTATVATTVGGASGAVSTLTGTVVAARGRGGMGRWEVIVNANNFDGNGNFILPLGYTFDAQYTDTTFT